MQRIFGALAIFGGWLCILLSAVFGLVASQFLGLDHFEGNPPPAGLYGVPAVVVMWIAVTAAILTAVPAAAAMFAPDPSRRLYTAAAVMGVMGVAMLPDELGRAYAAAIIPGAALFAVGGWWTHQAGAIGAEVGPDSTEAGATEPSSGLGPGPMGSAPVAGISSSGLSGVDSGASAAAPAKRSQKGSAKSHAKSKAEADAECPWCSAPIVVGADRCPSCGAALISAAETAAVAIPGVTAVAPELREYQERAAHQKKRPGLLSMVLDEFGDRGGGTPEQYVDLAALQPPSVAVRAEMERLDREIDAGRIVGEEVADPEVATAPAPEPTAPAGDAAAAPGANSADDRNPPTDS